MSAEASQRLTARFPRRSQRGVIAGISGVQLGLLGAALVFTVAGLWLGRAGMAVPVMVLLGVAPTWWTGRPLVNWVPYLGRWLLRGATGQRTYRARPLAPRPAGALGLPGDAARLRVLSDALSGAGLVHDPTTRTLTAVARVSASDSFVLAESERQDSVASGFGSVLAAFCEDAGSGVDRVQVLLRAISDSGEEVRAHFESEGTLEVSSAAHELYGEYLAASRVRSVRHEAWVSIRLKMTARGVAGSVRAAGGGVTGGAEVLRERMQHLRSRLGDAQVNFEGWCSSGDIAVLARTAYDPDSLAELEAHPEVGRSLAGAGPLAVDEAFTYFRTESGYQRVLWVVEWPRKQATAGFLQRLVIAQIRHTFTMVYEPIPTRRAITSARAASTAAETSRMWERKSGAIDTKERQRERQALENEENALEEGHGAMRFAGLVTVSADDLQELRVVTDQARTAAAQSGCELRILGGEQASAFIAGALPFGRGL